MVIDFKKLQIFLARKQLRMTQFFKDAHISSVTVKRMKSGCKVTVKTAGKLAAALGCDVTELLV